MDLVAPGVVLEEDKIVGPLIKGCTNANAQDKDGTTALHLRLTSFLRTDSEIMYLLPEHGVNENAQFRVEDLKGWISLLPDIIL